MSDIATLNPTPETPASPGPLPLPEHLQGRGLTRILTAVAPKIRQIRTRVLQGIQLVRRDHPSVPLDPAVLEQCLAAHLAEPLINMMTRAMALELNAGRLEGRLAGDTPDQRFESFIDGLGRPEVTAQLHVTYPVLFDQIAGGLNRWAEGSLTFAERLCEDWSALRQRFFRTDPGEVVQIQTNACNTHSDGHAAITVSFMSGARIVYKPRSLAVDEHFQTLLAWLNDRGAEPRLQLLNILDRGSYGWAEFVAAAPCGSASEVSRFYERQGSYIAVLYALGGVGLFPERLVAAGEHPFLIDLEALFHERPESGAADLDFTGLKNAPGRLNSRAAPLLDLTDEDEMNCAETRIEQSAFADRPTLQGCAVSAADYSGDVERGFASMYRLLLTHRAELMSQVDRFSEAEIRVLVRPTRVYGALLQKSHHPALLRHEDDRTSHLDQLEAIIGKVLLPSRLLDIELEDMMGGTIPIFLTRPSSRDLWTSDGARIAGFFECTALDHVKERLQYFDEEHLSRQLRIIRASLAAVATHREPPPGLMTGLAGIGYGLLRMAEPAQVPSVLALEPPRTQ